MEKKWKRTWKPQDYRIILGCLQAAMGQCSERLVTKSVCEDSMDIVGTRGMPGKDNFESRGFSVAAKAKVSDGLGPLEYPQLLQSMF